ncbi:MAG: hypothetical protein U1F77_13860 [Kiritimatiellia bacterium]
MDIRLFEPRAYDWTLRGWKWEHGIYTEFGGGNFLALGPLRVPLPDDLEHTLRFLITLTLLTGLLLALRYLMLLLVQGRSTGRESLVTRPSLLPSPSFRRGVARMSLGLAGVFILLCLLDLAAGASSLGHRDADNPMVHLGVDASGGFQLGTVPVSGGDLVAILQASGMHRKAPLLFQVHASRRTSAEDLNRLTTLLLKQDPLNIWIAFDQESWTAAARQRAEEIPLNEIP